MTHRDIIIYNKSLETRYSRVSCEECGKYFVLNDVIHTTSTRRYRTAYHKKCWDFKFH